jgi:hypothetical protein
MNIPCKGCPVLAMCRHRYYEDLIFKCIWIARYVSVHEQRIGYPKSYSNKLIQEHKRRIRKLIDVVKPTKWGITKALKSYGTGYYIKIISDSNTVHWAHTFF